MLLSDPLLSGRPLISGYGRGKFRLGGIEHEGSLMILPGGVYGWPVAEPNALTCEALSPALDYAGAGALGFLLLGTGATQVFPSRALRERFSQAGLSLEAMDTGAACRTYNVLLAEERVFAAALIAIS